MDIAIIGAGNVGRSLATAFVRAGHTVSITAREADHAEAAANATGASVGASNRQVAATASVIVLAAPFASVPGIAAEIGDVVADKVVIDATNRMSFGADGPDIDTATSNAEELAVLLPDAHVVKAFNTLFASNQSDPIADGFQLDGYVAADDPAARATVLDLVESIGLRPIDVGPLPRARQLEGLAFLNIAINIAYGGSWTSGWKLVGAPVADAVAA